MAFTGTALPQLNLNGLVKYDSFLTLPNHTNLKEIDFDQDGKMDLILTDRNNNQFVLFNKKDSLEQIQKFFFYPISDIMKFKNKEFSGQTYIFASQKENLCGLSAFTKYGTMLFLNKISFDSSPSFIDIKDYDTDDKEEALISGHNFNGLSILEEEDFILTERKIARHKAFSGAKFFDYNYDSYHDIVGFNIFDYSFEFYRNFQGEDFELARTLEIKENISQFEIIDINKDNFHDILFSSGNKFHIYYGDSVSSFTYRAEILFSHPLDKFTVGDFNLDNSFEIAAIDQDGSSLSIIFNPLGKRQRNIVTFSNPNKLVDITSVNDTIYTISDNGELSSFSRMDSISFHDKIKIARNASELVPFHSSYSEYPHFAAFDQMNGTISLLLSEEVPFNFFQQVNIVDGLDRIFAREINKDSISILLYSSGRSTFRKIGYNRTTNEVAKYDYYCNHKVMGVTSFNTGNKHEKIIAITKSKGHLYLESFILKGPAPEAHKVNKLSDSFVDALILKSNPPKIYYLKRDRNKILLNEVSSTGGITSNKYEFKINDESFHQYKLLEGYRLKDSLYQRIPLVYEHYKYYKRIIKVNEEELLQFKMKGASISLNENDDHQSIYYQNPESNNIEKIEYSSPSTFTTSKVIESNNINRYFGWFILKENLFILFDNKENSAVNIRSVK